MKYLLLLIGIYAGSHVSLGQDDIDQYFDDGGNSINNNIVSIDPLAAVGITGGFDISIFYERIFGKNFRFELGLGLWKESNSGPEPDVVNYNGEEILVQYGNNFRPIYRIGLRGVKPFYFMDSKMGFHYGFSFKHFETQYWAHKDFPIDKKIYYDLIFQLGWQFISTEHFQLNYIFGFGPSWARFKLSKEFGTNLEQEKDNFIGMDFGLRFGYKF